VPAPITGADPTSVLAPSRAARDSSLAVPRRAIFLPMFSRWRLLRHTEIKTTADFYTDALVEDIRDGLESTAKSIESQKKSQSQNSASTKAMKNKG
jgi:hypothetical protein